MKKALPDRDHAVSRGFICSKGSGAIADYRSGTRIIEPLRRDRDGRFRPVSLDDALNEISDRLGDILRLHGGTAVGEFNGTQSNLNCTLVEMMNAWRAAIGSPNKYSTVTIDQSCHLVTMARMGHWAAGKRGLDDVDVLFLVGTNPIVSLGAYSVLSADPVKRLKAARARGLELVVIDPRRTETAQQATLFIQPKPGYDAEIAAAIAHLIVRDGAFDHEFCNRYVDGLERLRGALAPFKPETVAARAGIDHADLETAARLLSSAQGRAAVVGGTGMSMARHSNLADHLLETLNALCGNYRREGETVRNPPVLAPSRGYYAEVNPPYRSWESSPINHSGWGQLFGEFPSSTLADEILRSGEQSIRALFVNAGNPATCLPDHNRAMEALRSLDLLVSIEPFMTATAGVSDFIIPPKLMFERDDVLFGPNFEAFLSDIPFGQYLPALVAAPNPQVVDDWYVYWSLARRMGLQLIFAGEPLDMEQAPKTGDLLRLLTRNANVPFDQVLKAPGGKVFAEALPVVAPPREGVSERFRLVPDDVAAEIKQLAAGLQHCIDEPCLQLIVRRERSVINSSRNYGRGADDTRIYLHPDDISRYDLEVGNRAEIEGSAGKIIANVAADETLRVGVASMAHCRLVTASDKPDELTSVLVRTDEQVEDYNAMPVMTGIAVKVRPMQGVTDS